MRGCLLAVLGLVACSGPPVVEIDRAGKAAPPAAELVIDGWHVEALADGSQIVLPGRVRHDVRQPRAEPTVAVAAAGGASVPALGVPWWVWVVGVLALVGGAAWYLKPWRATP